MDASCPSKRLEAVTKRMWCFGLYVVVVLILVLILLAFVGTWGQVPCPSVKLVNLCFTTKVVLLGMCGHSYVTVFTFLAGFGNARPLLRYRFYLFGWFWEPETIFALRFLPFWLISGT
jgi:hypothetical protein